MSFALRGRGRVATRLLEHRPSELCVSSITLAELRYGAEARRSRRLHRLISTFVEAIEVMSFDQSAAGRFAVVAAALARRRQGISGGIGDHQGQPRWPADVHGFRARHHRTQAGRKTVA